MAKNETLLELRGVTKSFVTADGAETAILKGVDLTMGDSESVAIVGPSGSGKSTLLNLIGTLDSPTSGSIFLCGRDTSSLPESERVRIRSERIGFVFQSHYLLPQCNVLENVLVPTLVRARDPGAQERARALLDRVGLSPRLSNRPGQLSGGECQRVAVVRALINQPNLLLADEPTGSLDRENAASLTELLFELNREEGVALILVTHAPALAAEAGRLLTLVDGILSTNP